MLLRCGFQSSTLVIVSSTGSVSLDSSLSCCIVCPLAAHGHESSLDFCRYRPGHLHTLAAPPYAPPVLRLRYILILFRMGISLDEIKASFSIFSLEHTAIFAKAIAAHRGNWDKWAPRQLDHRGYAPFCSAFRLEAFPCSCFQLLTDLHVSGGT